MLEFHTIDFNLQHTLECGQAFRWRRNGNGYVGVVGKSVWKVSQHSDVFTVESDPPVSKDEVIRYFSLSVDLQKMVLPFRDDPILDVAFREFWGLRLLRQDPWECLGSYIFSSLNNVKRISGLVENVSIRFGAPIGSNGSSHYAFPSAQAIASLTRKDLQPIRPGFRDRYLLESARSVSEGGCDLQKLNDLETGEAREALLKLPGVGQKVADCILLFAYGRTEVFPIDVWIERALRKLYFHGRHRTSRQMRRFTSRKFGSAAGYAQEYLYAYARNYL